MLNARLGDSQVRALIVDLEGGEAGFHLMQRLRGPAATPAERGIKIVAFGPHVEVDALRRAAAEGADAVMTRGSFSARLPELLKQLASDERVESALEE